LKLNHFLLALSLWEC